MDLSVAVVGRFQYVEPLEEMFARGFERIGCDVLRVKGPDAYVRIGGGSSAVVRVDFALCVKAEPPGFADRRALYFADLTARFPDQWRYFSARNETGVQFAYDAVFLPHKEPVVDRRRVFHVPVGYDPGFHPDVGWTGEGGYPLFVGTWRPEREWVRAYPGVRIFGNGWGGGVRDVYGAEKRALHRGCAFALNAHHPGETVNMRQFEAMAMGVPLVTDRAFPPCAKPCYETYADGEGARRALRALDADTLRILARRGRELVRPHTYAQRCATILKVMGLA